jgi:hypothetical protein
VLEGAAIPIAILYVHWWVLGGGYFREQRVVTATVANQEAQRIQPMLRNSGKCLDELSGWAPYPEYGGKALTTRVKGTGTSLVLDCSQERRRFWLTIRYGFDSHVDVWGSFEGPLTITYGHPTAPESKVIPPKPDIRALAKLLAYGGS